MSEAISMVTAMIIIVIILISSGSRILMRRNFEKNLQPHLQALEKASKKNAELKINGV